VLRKGARALLAQAVEAEVATLLSRYADETTDDGRKRLVRHGHLPEREIMTGIGPVGVRCPRVRDRVGEGSQRIRFSSAILPPYARRSKSLEVLIPILYLKKSRNRCAALSSNWPSPAIHSLQPRPQAFGSPVARIKTIGSFLTFASRRSISLGSSLAAMEIAGM
jgi:hypothetical protein